MVVKLPICAVVRPAICVVVRAAKLGGRKGTKPPRRQGRNGSEERLETAEQDNDMTCDRQCSQLFRAQRLHLRTGERQLM